MFIKCQRGTISADQCPTSTCPQPCPERTERLQKSIERMEAHQKRLIDTYRHSPTAIYYEVVGAVQERIEAARAEL